MLDPFEELEQWCNELEAESKKAALAHAHEPVLGNMYVVKRIRKLLDAFELPSSTQVGNDE